MKTPPAKLIERGPDGSYPNSLGQSLSAEEKRAIRNTLCNADSPLYLTEIASRSGINFMNAGKQQAAAQFVETYLVSTHECQMTFLKNARGQERFMGWSATKHCKDLMEKGLL
jgi:hypothetical protein